LLAAWYFTRRATIVPSRLQSLVEFPIEWTARIVESNGGRHWRSFTPLVVAIFLFVLLANWIGLLPGVGTIGYHEEINGQQVLVPFVARLVGRPELHPRAGARLVLRLHRLRPQGQWGPALPEAHVHR